MGKGPERRRRHSVLGDPGALGEQTGERGGAHRPEHRGRCPRSVVVVGVRPPGRRQPAVDPLDEVAAVVVALRGGQPLRRTGPPRAVGGDGHHPAVGVVDRHLDEEARGRRRAAPARPVPVVEDADGVGPSGDDCGRDVGGLVVLLVREAEARAGVDPGAVHPQLVLVGARHVGGGIGDGSLRQSPRGAEVGVLLLTGVGRTRTQPERPPVGDAAARW